MRVKVNRIACGVAAALLCAPAVLATPPESRPRSLERRWIPSLAVTSGITFQQMDSSFDSLCAFGGPPVPTLGDTACVNSGFFGSAGPLRPPDSGSALAITPYVGGSLQLLSPTIPVPGRPRAFVNGDFQAFFAASRQIAKEGDAGTFEFPVNSANEVRDPEVFPSSAITGQGTETVSTVQTLSYGAGLGIAFPFDFRERRLWIKPSAGWIRYGVDVEGELARAVKNDFPPPPPQLPPPPPFGASVREVRLSGSDSLTFNGVGGGLELELETVRWGPVGTTLFLRGDAYYVLGNRSTEFSACSSTVPDLVLAGLACSTIEPDGVSGDIYRANWRYEADPLLFRLGLGMRFHWLGSLR